MKEQISYVFGIWYVEVKSTYNKKWVGKSGGKNERERGRRERGKEGGREGEGRKGGKESHGKEPWRHPERQKDGKSLYLEHQKGNTSLCFDCELTVSLFWAEETGKK